MSKENHPAVTWAIDGLEGAKAALVNAHAAVEFAQDELRAAKRGKKRKKCRYERDGNGGVGPA